LPSDRRADNPQVSARLVRLDRIAPSDLDSWQRLAGAACEPNPFFEPQFVLAAQRLFGGGRLLVAERDGGWLGCLPVRRPLPGVLRAWAHSYCFLGTPLVDGAHLDEAAAALVGAARLLVLDRQAADGPVADAVARALRERGMVPFHEAGHERAALHRRAAGDYLAAMRPHRRREFRRQARRLEEELGATLEVRDVSGDASAADRFLALESSGWKGRAGTALGSKPDHAAFFREICDSFRALGRLQMLEMTCGERTVAMKCNLAAGDGVFCFKIAHDEALNRFSPGVQLEIAHVERFHGDRSEPWADSCAAADNEMINRLWPDRRRIVSYAVSPPGTQALFGHGARTYQTLRSRKRSEPSLAS
jgi:CelD/BcsL family acetyltransferase involved in cellulose biosynthesis